MGFSGILIYLLLGFDFGWLQIGGLLLSELPVISTAQWGLTRLHKFVIQSDINTIACLTYKNVKTSFKVLFLHKPSMDVYTSMKRPYSSCGTGKQTVTQIFNVPFKRVDRSSVLLFCPPPLSVPPKPRRFPSNIGFRSDNKMQFPRKKETFPIRKINFLAVLMDWSFQSINAPRRAPARKVHEPCRDGTQSKTEKRLFSLRPVPLLLRILHSKLSLQCAIIRSP